jgi:hypothetical protein
VAARIRPRTQQEGQNLSRNGPLIDPKLATRQDDPDIAKQRASRDMPNDQKQQITQEYQYQDYLARARKVQSLQPMRITLMRITLMRITLMLISLMVISLMLMSDMISRTLGRPFASGEVQVRVCERSGLFRPSGGGLCCLAPAGAKR